MKGRPVNTQESVPFGKANSGIQLQSLEKLAGQGRGLLTKAKLRYLLFQTYFQLGRMKTLARNEK